MVTKWLEGWSDEGSRQGPSNGLLSGMVIWGEGRDRAAVTHGERGYGKEGQVWEKDGVLSLGHAQHTVP